MNREIIERFEMHLTAERGASGATIESCKRDVTGFGDYLNKNTDKELIHAEESDIRSYISVLQAKGKAVSTVSRCISSLKCFYSWLREKRMISVDPTEAIEKQKVVQKSPDILSYSDIRKILAGPDGKDPKSLRDRAMLETLYATGMRASEIININVNDVDIIGKSIRCSDGSSFRLIPIHNKAAAALEEYLRLSRPGLLSTGSRSDALFVNLSGGRLTRQGFWKIMKYYQEKAGIDVSISPKTLRHSFAVNLMENGADVYSVKEMLGHKDIVSTKKYNRLVNEKVKEVYFSSHPRV